ncbi:pD-(D/E)xk nuclease superfamily [Caudoviricetes sp.]|nr:pD-(D/E)xk nuclease superfamily [Caudoviricetes sp.]
MHGYYAILEAGLAPGSTIAMEKLRQRFLADLGEAGNSLTIKEMIRDVSTVVKMFGETVSKELDKNLNIQGIEQYFSREITLSDGTVIVLHGYADLHYVLKTGTVVIRDLKTGEDSRSWSAQKVFINIQLLIYLYLSHLTYPEATKFRGEILFLLTKWFAKGKPMDERYKYLTVGYTVEELEAAFQEIEKLLIEAANLTEQTATMALDKDTCAHCQYNVICDEKLRGKDTAVTISKLYRKRETDDGARPNPIILANENTSGQEPESNPMLLDLRGWNRT